ncbi:B12-binding domain-containing radical SAM protein [Candidatus Woesearchaeota archaeon]|nr:B12-binding domain-containing radical SAM protein [Candidatus Woesearchaeota archaeon]
MKILLVNPPFHRFFGSEQDYIPLGLSYLAATYEDCFVYNCEIDRSLKYAGYSKRISGHAEYLEGLKEGKHPIWDDVKKRIGDYNPDVVGIYAPTVKLESAYKVAEIVKEINPSIKTIAGGPHPTIRPDEVSKNSFIDIAFAGEGEDFLPKLIDDIKKGKEKRECINRGFIEDIDKIRFPAREKMLDEYSPSGYGHIISSRGCPFLCAYCGSRSIWHRKVRFRSVQNIIQEIKETIDKCGTRDFTFWDESFTLRRQRILDFCKAVKKLGVTWRCDTRIDIIDEELIKVMMDSGCRHMSFGIESGNQETLNFIRKGITLEQIYKTANMLNKLNVPWKAYLMIGFPNETEEQIKETINIIEKIRPKRVTLSLFTPYPGTELFDYCLEKGIIDSNVRWELYSHQSKFNYFSPKIPKEKYGPLVEWATKKVDEYNKAQGGYNQWENKK